MESIKKIFSCIYPNSRQRDNPYETINDSNNSSLNEIVIDHIVSEDNLNNNNETYQNVVNSSNFSSYFYSYSPPSYLYLLIGTPTLYILYIRPVLYLSYLQI